MGDDAHSHSFTYVKRCPNALRYVCALTAFVCWPIAKPPFYRKRNKCTLSLMYSDATNYGRIALSHSVFLSRSPLWLLVSHRFLVRCLIYCLMIAIKCLKAKKQRNFDSPKSTNSICIQYTQGKSKEKQANNIIVSSNYFMNGCTGRS